MSFFRSIWNFLFGKKPAPVVVPPKAPPVVVSPPTTTPPPVVTPPVVTPSPPVTTTPTPPVSTPPVTTPDPNVVFNASFDNRNDWVVGKTSAFPAGTGGIQTNPGDDKLDAISPAWAPVGGEFIATRSAVKPPLWNADLVTTEGSPNGFKAKPGDTLEAQVTVYTDKGAWPAIWTWAGPSAEVDLFEYHSDNPTMLELTNHVTGGSKGTTYDYANGVVTPGKTFDLKVSFLTTGVQWFVDGKLVFTGSGVPSNWSGYLIVNMSVSDGTYHPAPDAAASQLKFSVTGLKVTR